jgi:hypothetical protein
MPPTSKIGDPVRDMIRASVQHHLLPKDEAPPLHPIPEGVVSVEARAITPHGTRITVTMETGGPRYFWVKVTEEW